MKLKSLILGLICISSFLASNNSFAQAFFDTAPAEKFFNLGARIGFNTSNRTFPGGNYSNYIMTTWGTGFNAGAIANINFREYLTLQPGFFFESRSGNLVNIVDYYRGSLATSSNLKTHYSVNHLRAYYFTIPVMGIIRFNLANNVKWNVEFGPYLQFELNESGQKDIHILYRNPQSMEYAEYFPSHSGFDVGFKMGSSIQVFSHYYVGFHYLAGLCNAWKMPAGGHNKSWMFSLGYDF